MRTRRELTDLLRSGDAIIRPDVLIVGGGINGVGVFRDLAAQNVAALLVERNDFCSGTSAAPSRLAHGGLRYLEIGEIALVRESVEERNLMLLNAGHLVRPLRTWVPLASWTGGMLSAAGRFAGLVKAPGRKGAAAVKLGLVIYDLFGRANRSMPTHRLISRAEALRVIPDLAPGVRAVAEYYDARITHPERLTLELIGDAETDCPRSAAINYLAVESAAGGDIVLRDAVSGERFTVSPRLVVNTAGAWADDVQGRLGAPDKLIGGTKGIHLVLRRPDLARRLDDRMLYFETADHRACLIYPLDENHLLLGTTDIRTDDPEDVACTDADIDYLFGVLGSVLPKAGIGRGDIVFTYGGVRPLPLTERGVTGAISRDHIVKSFEPTPERPFPLLTLIGGKWTTYRSCAAQIATSVLDRLGRPRPTDTRRLPIGGGRDFPRGAEALRRFAQDVAASGGISIERAAILVDRYGTIAADFAAAERGGGAALATLPLYTTSEIARLATFERVERLADIVLRRTLVAMKGDATEPAIRELGSVVGEALGWSDGRIADEVEACLALLAKRHSLPS